MLRNRKKLTLFVALAVIGATQLTLAGPAHAEEVCVPITTQTDLGPGLLLCAGAGNDYDPDYPEVWADVYSYDRSVASTRWTLRETGGGRPIVYSWTNFNTELVTLTVEVRPEGRPGTYVRVCATVGGGDPVCVLPQL